MSPSKNVRTWAAALVVTGATVACSSQDMPPRPPPPQARSSVAAETAQQPAPAPAAPLAAAPAADEPVSGMLDKTITSTAVVTAIDLEKRQVTLRNEDGKSSTIVCGPEVRNLPQVKVGDLVTCEYRQSISYEVKKPGEARPGASLTGAAGRAKEGEMPAAAAGQALTVTATIVAIDRETNRVSLQGPDGDVAVVQVRDPAKLARVSVGELVEITYTEAMAISVSTPMAK
jgi:Cu/Ag efflux protein CusF